MIGLYIKEKDDRRWDFSRSARRFKIKVRSINGSRERLPIRIISYLVHPRFMVFDNLENAARIRSFITDSVNVPSRILDLRRYNSIYRLDYVGYFNVLLLNDNCEIKPYYFNTVFSELVEKFMHDSGVSLLIIQTKEGYLVHYYNGKKLVSSKCSKEQTGDFLFAYVLSDSISKASHIALSENIRRGEIRRIIHNNKRQLAKALVHNEKLRPFYMGWLTALLYVGIKEAAKWSSILFLYLTR